MKIPAVPHSQERGQGEELAAVLAVKIKMADEPRPRIPISADWVLKRIQEGKNVRLRNAVIEGNLDINKLDLPTRHVKRTELQKQLGLAEDVKIVQSSIDIRNSTIQGQLDFSNSTFSGDAKFSGATLRIATFKGAIFEGDAWFNGATFEEAFFNGATFGDAFFKEATFSNHVWFNGATFNETVWFNGATFGDAWFNGATFEWYAWFDGSKFEGDVLTFRDAAFTLAKSQEEACRRAKNVLEKNGDREEAGDHFYREMEAKRKQKDSNYRYFDYETLFFCKEINAPSKKLTDLRKYLRYNILEYLLFQVIFGYGVRPPRLWGFWMFMVGVLAYFYWMGSGVNDSVTAQPLTSFWECLWFSITVAVTPGFSGYKPVPGFYQVLAGGEAIFGTFMWAAFITTFAKKYMR